MDVTAVPTALRHGATLYAGMRASQVLVEGGRATGVVARARGGGPELTVRADAVISACGTISGVPFLRGSGIRSRHLGRRMTLHPATKIVALMPEEVNGWLDTPQGYGVHGLQDQGIMYEGAFVPPSYAAIAFPFAGKAFTQVMEQYRRLAMFGLMVEDEGSGRVRSGLGGRPIITYTMAKSDLEKTRRGLLTLAEIFCAAGAEKIFLPIAGMEEQASMDATRAALADPLDPWSVELVAFHPLGTARMSSAASDGVVNPELESWEIPGLYVMDGSVLPTSLGVNPQMTIMAYTSRAAEHLAARIG
jgi:choline dehydrogenase-like flavoprotein